MSACIVEYLDAIRVPTVKTGESSSVVVFGKDARTREDVVLKITPSTRDQTSNSLEVERQVYMFLSQQPKEMTVHLATGIMAGVCDSSRMMQVKGFERETPFGLQWRELRGSVIVQQFDPGRIQSLKDRFRTKLAPPNESARETMQRFFRFISDAHTDIVTDVHYVMTPKIPGISLSAAVELATDGKIPLPAEFDNVVAIQVAQALCATAAMRMMHNDLHTGNILVEYLKTPETISYTFPFPFSLTTSYRIKIFDYDFSFVESVTTRNSALDTGFCQRAGSCNRFTPLFDWELFLRFFVGDLEQVRQTHLRPLIGGTFRSPVYAFGNKGQPALAHRPCICVEENDVFAPNSERRCTRCEIRISKDLVSPENFLQCQLASGLPYMKEPKLKVVPPPPEKLDPEEYLRELRSTDKYETTSDFLARYEEESKEVEEQTPPEGVVNWLVGYLKEKVMGKAKPRKTARKTLRPKRDLF